MVSAFALAGCTADSADEFKACHPKSDGSGVYGRALDGFGEQVSEARIVLEVNGSSSYKVKDVADRNGCFAYDTPPGRVAVHCEKPGMGSDRKNVTVADAPVEVNCLLSSR